MINEDVKKIISCAGQNGIALGRNFNEKYLSAHGFYDGPAEVAEQALKDMLKLCAFGVNCGFDGNLRSALDKLSDVVVSLTEVASGNTKELAKLDMQRERVVSSVRDSEYEVESDVREEIRKYIQTSVQAIDSMTALYGEGEVFTYVDGKQFEYLEKCKTLFGEISFALTNVMDVTSADSAEYAEKVIAEMIGWRRDCSNFMCTSDTVARLERAKEFVNGWAQLERTPTRRERAKTFPVYKPDDISVLGQSRGTIETVRVFSSRIETEFKDIESKQQEYDEDLQRRNELTAKLAQTKLRGKEIVAEYKNTGDVVKANRDTAELKRETDRIEGEIARIDRGGRLERKRVELEGRRRVADELKGIYDMLSEYKSDPVFLAKASQKIDFNALVSILTGRFSQADMAKTISGIQNVRARMDVIARNRTEILETISFERESSEKIFNGLNSLENTVKEGYGKTKLNEDGMTDDFKALLESFEAEQPEKVTEKNEADGTVIPLTDDDK